MTATIAPRFIVMTSSAHVQGKAARFGRYRNVAVVELDDTGVMPKMISSRAHGLKQIVRHYGSRSVGRTERCQYAVALREANELVARLNAA